MFDAGGWGLVAVAAVILLVAKALRISLVLVILLLIAGTVAWDWVQRAVLGG